MQRKIKKYIYKKLAKLLNQNKIFQISPKSKICEKLILNIFEKSK